MGNVVQFPRQPKRVTEEDDWWINCVPFIRWQWAARRKAEQLLLAGPKAEHSEDTPP